VHLGLQVPHTSNVCRCAVCQQAKARHAPIRRKGSQAVKAEATMDCLHVDLMGPVNATLHGTQKERILSLGGNTYILNCVEGRSHYVLVRLARHKSEVPDLLIAAITFLQTQTGKKLKMLRSDGAPEFCNAKINAFLKANGTAHSTPPAHKPALNGIAERMNRTLMEMARAMLIQSGAPLPLWGEAINAAAFTYNCSIQVVGGRNDAPARILFGSNKCPDPNRLRVFGCDVWHTLPHVEQSKLSPRAERAMFVGYSADGLKYRILKPNSSLAAIMTRDVTFDEDSFTVSAELVVNIAEQREADLSSAPRSSQVDPGLALGRVDEMAELQRHTQSPDEDDVVLVSSTAAHQQQQQPLSEQSAPSEPADNQHQILPSSSPPSPSDPEEKYEEESDYQPSEADSDSLEQERDGQPQADATAAPHTSAEQTLRRSTRASRQPDLFPGIIRLDALTQLQQQSLLFGALIAAADIHDVKVDPTSYKQALARPDARKWADAIAAELLSMEKNQVWKLVFPPPGATIIKSRWVFKVKLDEHNQPVKWKARLVAKGFQQVHGVNYDETFAPVAKHKSIKLVMAIVNELDLELKQIDFVTAFLNAPLDYEVYMEQPEGMPTRGDGRALLLRRALYGLKQSPRQWNIELHNWLVQRGYRPILQDPCIYVKHTTEGRVIILFLYVDDTGVAYHKKDEAIWEADKAALSTRFPISDLGDCQWLLGMEVRRDRAKGTLTISQQAYTERVLKQFNLLECKHQPLPMAHGGELGELPLDDTPVKPLNAEGKRLYQSMIGSLLYAACLTRMDLAFATVKLARFSAAPADHHLVAAKRALRYLAGTRNLGLVFRRSGRKIHLDPTVYPDASWISEVDTGRSHSGVITLLNGNPIHWWSKQQSMVALSSTESEYIAMGEAAKDAVWLREWLISVLGVETPIRVLCDNQAAIKIANADTDSARTRHYSARHHYVRQLINEHQLKLEWTNTNEQAADLLTKQLTLEKLRIWRDRFLTAVTL